jgi:cell division protein FtsW
MAVIAEELGLIGVTAVLALFIFVVVRAYQIGRQAAFLERHYSALVAQGLGVWIGVQAMINIGVNMGVLPTKGLTLPFLSFGGSGIVVNCIAAAVLLRVDFENRKAARGLPI